MVSKRRDARVEETVEMLRQVVGDGAKQRSGEQDDLKVLLRKKHGDAVVLFVAIPPRILSSSLTKRESQVAALIGHHLGNAGIADRLGISESRVARLIEQIKSKWGMSTRAEIARYSFLFIPVTPDGANSPG